VDKANCVLLPGRSCGFLASASARGRVYPLYAFLRLHGIVVRREAERARPMGRGGPGATQHRSSSSARPSCVCLCPRGVPRRHSRAATVMPAVCARPWYWEETGCEA